MGIAAGTKLGPYQIEAPLGAGGMGEVYRARDTRLDRVVAIKVLPQEFAATPHLRERLDREARAVSKLSHPHICTLYDVGHQDGVDYLVLEHLEGETLEQRLERGPLSPELVVRYGIQIADALARAHRAGIVHRDLKPGNVMLTKSGAKLLDFGLAKTQGTAPAIAALSQMATADRKLTEEGTLLGTFQYMAPEQLEGNEADARTDIFALGVVLYEMATGRPAFTGKTRASLIASILSSEPPPISTFQKVHPPALDKLVRLCMAKDPDERIQSAHDVKLQLLAIAEAQQGTMSIPIVRPSPWGAIATLLAIGLLVVAVVLLMRRADAPAPTAGIVRASLLPPEGHSFAPFGFAVSPDGTRLAFVATSADGISTLWVRSLDSTFASELSGTEGASHPFWSPDSRWIAYFADGKLRKVEPGGSGMQVICDAVGQGGAWGSSGHILFRGSILGPVMKVDAAGGAPQAVTKIPDEARSEVHRNPEFLPDGKRFLYTAIWTTPERAGLYLASLDGGEPRRLSGEIRGRVIFSRGHLLYLLGGTLYAQPFDAEAGALKGEPKAVIQQEIETDWRFRELAVSASQTGVIVYRSKYAYKTQLTWFERSGKELGVVGAAYSAQPRLSADATHVAVQHDASGGGQPAAWIYDLRRGIGTQISKDGIVTGMAWSPDGRQLAYSAERGKIGIYRRAVDLSSDEEMLVEGAHHMIVNDWSPDGRYIVYMNFQKGAPELWRYDLEKRASEFVNGGAEGAVSPDGRWLAQTGQAGAGGIAVGPFGGTGARLRVSAGLGHQARWRRDGKELFFLASDKKLMSVSVTEKDGRLEFSEPRPLFQTRVIEAAFALMQYSPSADGQRFLINSLPREDAAAPLNLLVNWQEELKK